MLEIKITAPELSEALNHLAKALSLATANSTGFTAPVSPAPAATNGVSVAQPAENAENASPVVPTAPTSAVPTASAVPNVQPASYPTPDVSAPAPVQPVPTAAPKYTLEMIAKAGTALIDAGKMDELSALLAKYGVEALTTLDPAHYGTFVAELRAMGAAI